MKIARLLYDEEHLFGPPTHLHLAQNGTKTKTPKQKATKASNSAASTIKPVSEADVAVTTIRVLPLPMPDAHPVNLHPTGEYVDSKSDKDSVEEAKLEEYSMSHDDIVEDSDTNDNTNEEETTIDDCSNLKWNFGPLTEELTQPTNMYLGPGPLDHFLEPHSAARITMTLGANIHSCIVSRVVLFQLRCRRN
jgi:hypothetical protein